MSLRIRISLFMAALTASSLILTWGAQAMAPNRFAPFCVLLMGFLMLLAAATVLHHFLLRPVRQFIDRMRAITRASDPESRLDETAPGELGALAREFNRMLDRVAADITQRKLAEESLAETTKRLERERANLQAIFDAAQVGMLLVDENTEVTRVNSVVSRLLGRDAAELLGHQPGDGLCCIYAAGTPGGCGHTSACPQCPLRNAFERVLRTGEETRDLETEQTLLVNGQERSFWLSVSVTALNLDGKRHALLAITDITARKASEDTLRRTMDQLERFNRLAVGREKRIVELKRAINEMLAGRGQPPRYRVDTMPVEAEADDTPAEPQPATG